LINLDLLLGNLDGYELAKGRYTPSKKKRFDIVIKTDSLSSVAKLRKIKAGLALAPEKW
jgi:hypothetical protein